MEKRKGNYKEKGKERIKNASQKEETRQECSYSSNEREAELYKLGAEEEIKRNDKVLKRKRKHKWVMKRKVVVQKWKKHEWIVKKIIEERKKKRKATRKKKTNESWKKNINVEINMKKIYKWKKKEIIK